MIKMYIYNETDFETHAVTPFASIAVCFSATI